MLLVSTQHCLGVIIDSNLSFKNHVAEKLVLTIQYDTIHFIVRQSLKFVLRYSRFTQNYNTLAHKETRLTRLSHT